MTRSTARGSHGFASPAGAPSSAGRIPTSSCAAVETARSPSSCSATRARATTASTRSSRRCCPRPSGVSFTIICSDVIYPSGEMGEYRTRFFRPYRDCDADLRGPRQPRLVRRAARLHVAPAADRRAAGRRSRSARALAAAAARACCGGARARPDDADLADVRKARSRTQPALRPAAAGPVLGARRRAAADRRHRHRHRGTIDAEQAAWLRRVSLGDPRPKILLTGKPLIVNGHGPGAIEAGARSTTSSATPRTSYVAAIGGDIHNYQRYPSAAGRPH